MYDWFVAPLRCPNCGKVSPADSSTGIQTKIRPLPDLSFLRVGDAIDDSPEVIKVGGYLPLRPVRPGEPIHLLEQWTCPYCGTRNWAEIVLHKGIIRSIDAVELDRAALARSHFITWFLEFDFEEITGQPLYQDGELRPDFIDLLNAHLPG